MNCPKQRPPTVRTDQTKGGQHCLSQRYCLFDASFARPRVQSVHLSRPEKPPQCVTCQEIMVLLVGVFDCSRKPMSSQSEVKSLSFFHVSISERYGSLKGIVGRTVLAAGVSELVAEIGVDDPDLLLGYLRTPSRFIGSALPLQRH